MIKGKGREGKTQVEKRRVSLMYFIVDIKIFLLSEQIMGDRIDTVATDFVNDLNSSSVK